MNSDKLNLVYKIILDLIEEFTQYKIKILFFKIMN